ncbi:MAG TPA: hypothetical protein VJU61_13460, partial [Polyangiaceae bacterium]|nr:hypothetical protein [Polyangiaceae bacterium]
APRTPAAPAATRRRRTTSQNEPAVSPVPPRASASLMINPGVRSIAATSAADSGQLERVE